MNETLIENFTETQLALPQAFELQTLKPKDLNRKARTLSRLNQKSDLCLISYLSEVERRRTYFDEGFNSLFSFLTGWLGFTESEAAARFHSARLVSQVPEVKEGLARGEYTITQLAKVQSVIRKEEKEKRVKFSKKMKQDILLQVKDKSVKQTERILAETLQIEAIEGPRVIEKPKANGKVEVTLTLSKELMENLEKIKEIYSHKCPGADLVDVLELMAKEIRAKKDLSLQKSCRVKARPPQKTPDQKSPPEESSQTLSTKCKGPKAIPLPIKRAVFQRDHGKCQHRKPNGEICGSRHQVQFDHITPRFAGGSNETSNLQLLCFNHNQLKYLKQIGRRRT